MIVVLVAGLAWVVSGSLEEPVTVVGDRAPNFAVTTRTGQTITPNNFGGKLLVLNFWATWCPPCVQEIPSLQEFQDEFASQGVVVVGVSVDKNPGAYDQFLKRFGVTFDTARDPDWNIAGSYGTYQLPETYIINADGEVVQKIIAAQDWMNPTFLNGIRDLL